MANDEFVDTVLFEAKAIGEDLKEHDLDFLNKIYVYKNLDKNIDSFENDLDLNVIKDAVNSKDLDFENIRSVNVNSLSTLHNYIGLKDEHWEILFDETVNHLRSVDIIGQELSEEVKFYLDQENKLNSYYDFGTDNIRLVPDKWFSRDSFPALIGHELTHKDNKEIMVGRDNVDDVRKSIEDFNRLSKYQRQILEYYTMDKPSVTKSFAKGVLFWELQDYIDLESGEDLIDVGNREFKYGIEYSPVRDEFEVTLFEEKDYQSIDNFESVSKKFSKREDINLENFVSEIIEDESIGQKILSELDIEVENAIKRTDKLKKEAPEIVEEYNFEALIIRDETTSWLTHFYIADQMPKIVEGDVESDLERIRGYYNERDDYPERAGDEIVEGLLDFGEVIQESSRKNEKVYQDILNKDKRKKYLLEGEFPVLRYSSDSST